MEGLSYEAITNYAMYKPNSTPPFCDWYSCVNF